MVGWVLGWMLGDNGEIVVGLWGGFFSVVNGGMLEINGM